jgi:transcriptional regulator with XRE-family HTH domain
MTASDDLLYQIVGEKIRIARSRQHPVLSQAKLAQRLGISRASVVNIEAGRQHAPLHVLWQIAENVGVELALLLPCQDEYGAAAAPVHLDAETVAQIEGAANGDPRTKRLIAQFVGRVQTRANNHETDES